MDGLSSSGVAPTLCRVLAEAPSDTEDALFLVQVRLELGDSPSVHPASGEDAFYWAAPSGQFVATSGAAGQVALGSDFSYEALARGAKALFGGVRRLGSEGPSPRLFGGIAFAPDTPRSELWQPFGSACFSLPRFALERVGGEHWFSVAARRPELELGVEAIVGEATRWLAEVLRPRPRAPEARLLARQEEPDRTKWRDLLAQVRDGMQAQRWEKIVAARRTICRFDRPLDGSTALELLGELAPTSTRFCLSKAGKTFLGATPEWLVKKQGRQISTEAMAGSIDARANEAAARLLASAKDLAEHAAVVEHIRRELAPLSRDLTVPSRPMIRQLKDILHLHTPISGTLEEDVPVLELVRRLHPTPAVGGVPTREALSWIAEHEQADRGFYAGPLGWFNEAGDGEFVVALRAGLLEGATAHLYAGAGIVKGSDPDSEYDETELKLASMLGALGVVD